MGASIEDTVDFTDANLNVLKILSVKAKISLSGLLLFILSFCLCPIYFFSTEIQAHSFLYIVLCFGMAILHTKGARFYYLRQGGEDFNNKNILAYKFQNMKLFLKEQNSLNSKDLEKIIEVLKCRFGRAKSNLNPIYA